MSHITLNGKEIRLNVNVVFTGLAVPFLVEMGEGIFWILEARSDAPGIDYFAAFDLAFKRT